MNPLRLIGPACLFAVFTYSLPAVALTSLSDDELSETTGQAIIKLEQFDNVAQSSGDALNFTRLSVGAKIDINMNIESLKLGNYYRPDPAAGTCEPGSPGVCTAQYGNNDPWACTTETCGGVDGTFKWPNLVNGNGDISFSDLPGGFEKVPNWDVALRYLSMGYKDKDGNLIPATLVNPYIDFAMDANGNLEGLRFGYGSASGVMGNMIDVITGNIRPGVDVLAKGLLNISLGTQEINFSGVRTPGYIQESIGVILGLDLKDLSHEAQLRPVGSLLLSDAADMFFSVNNRPIDYPENPRGILSPTAGPGFWINMDDGLTAATYNYKNPDNYFENHPLTQILRELGAFENYYDN
ncbi:hypothetical protein [Parendozoicomonas haliclonae]|uniref:Uncharacterized protein n=1 Tax=Parendozoicomonas haliclonae TaxID=1960125 RepID=A0A1X7APT5_9GAMM|nr:hypothetical protein [Parendozoicomonas haliclonae]SMA50153.1 hypothetical protein EHSB41UT_03944 [Parendozoicomonas haliclonae]